MEISRSGNVSARSARRIGVCQFFGQAQPFEALAPQTMELTLASMDNP
jgi:hypothetical protein